MQLESTLALVGDPYLRSFVHGLLYWAGQSVGPAMIGLFGYFWASSASRARKAKEDLNRGWRIGFSDNENEDTDIFVTRIQSFHEHMMKTLKRKSLRRLKNEGDLASIGAELSVLKSRTPDSLVGTQEVQEYFAAVDALFDQLREATNKSKASYDAYSQAKEAVLLLIEKLGTIDPKSRKSIETSVIRGWSYDLVGLLGIVRIGQTKRFRVGDFAK